MLFSFEEIIPLVTRDETLMPGEFIGQAASGTAAGLSSAGILSTPTPSSSSSKIWEF
jgi:2-keto-4-pentenoate hydratase/2-oxohepta-3-ene-1,7-dioic acid hydratase in catechol pathway